jgi:phosphatidyl-myo-inositol alpha-mannosyltransferase
MRVGLVCPYAWDVPGGVQAHVRDLAEALQRLGHEVSVLAPTEDADAEVPDYVEVSGRAVPVPYNGSVARLAFGPLSARRVRRWLRDGHFDVLHLHEPASPSLGLLALLQASGPVVATMHTAMERSRAMSTLSPALQPALEKLTARIAVSEAARNVLVENLGGDAVLIPNGVSVSRFADADPFDGWPGTGGAIGFLGRLDEPRKGLPVLLEAFTILAPGRPGLRLLLAGPGDAEEVREALPAELVDRVTLLGRVSDADLPRVYSSVDVYCAPNLGGESFGIVLLEAMAAGAAVVSSDLDAFRRVLDDGRAGFLTRVGDARSLAGGLAALLDDPPRRESLRAVGSQVVAQYDWEVVARRVVGVYETVAVGGTGVVPLPESADPDALELGDGSSEVPEDRETMPRRPGQGERLRRALRIAGA